MPIPLAERLRTATHELHAEVERAGVMRQLLRGQIDAAGYCALLRNLHAVYAALEAGLRRHATHPALVPVAKAVLFRGAALERDLDRLHGPGWADDIALVPAAADYAERLRTLAADAPALLAAHAYVRYLGDLSGGQTLARLIAGHLGLAAGEAVDFYDFGPADQVAAMKRDFRAGLDSLADDEALAQALVDEACAAFARHKPLFEQLAEPRATAGAPAP
jgi:heme oxygenase